MNHIDLQHFEFGWDLHTDRCATCDPLPQLMPDTRERLCPIGKKYFDQWFELFNYVESQGVVSSCR